LINVRKENVFIALTSTALEQQPIVSVKYLRYSARKNLMLEIV